MCFTRFKNYMSICVYGKKNSTIEYLFTKNLQTTLTLVSTRTKNCVIRTVLNATSTVQKSRNELSIILLLVDCFYLAVHPTVSNDCECLSKIYISNY